MQESKHVIVWQIARLTGHDSAIVTTSHYRSDSCFTWPNAR